jgi:secreted trypsin-like serine protease
MYAGDNHSSAYPGDSGGPLVWYDRERRKYILYGVASFRGTKERCPLLNVFHFVPSSLDWIHNTILMDASDITLRPLATNAIKFRTTCTVGIKAGCENDLNVVAVSMIVGVCVVVVVSTCVCCIGGCFWLRRRLGQTKHRPIKDVVADLDCAELI